MAIPLTAFYHASESESPVHDAHNWQLFGYVMLRHASYEADKSQFVMKGVQSYLQATSGISQTQKSEYTYLHVLDKNADNKETILEVLSWLHHEFDVGNHIQHLVVTGDAKTYMHLINLKCEYGEALSWLVAFPGDFHALRNYHEVLMKVYWDAGLSICK